MTHKMPWMIKETDITPRRLSNIIAKVKLHLIEKIETDGVGENFGQDEVKMLAHCYINPASAEGKQWEKRNLVNVFDNWVMSRQDKGTV